MPEHLDLESLSKVVVAILVLLFSSVLVVHVLPRQESNTTPMAIPPSITSFCVYAAILFQHLDPRAIIFAPCVTERLRRLTGPLTAKSAPAGAISNVGGLA